jgi:hypothetical protein
VTLKGTRFAPEPQQNLVLFGDQTGRLLSATAAEVRAEVPEVAVAPGGEVRVGVRLLAGDRAAPAAELLVYRDASSAEGDAEAPPFEAPEEAPSSPETAGPPVLASAAKATPPPERPAAQSRPAPERRRVAAAPREPAPEVPVPAAAPAPEPPRSAPQPPAAPPASQRGFVLERTAATSSRKADERPAGFDPASIELKRAPEVPGRIDFEVTPAHVKAGDACSVTAYLINDGDRSIRIKEMYVATSVNGVLTAGPARPRLRDLSPKQRAVVGVFSHVWGQNVSSWALDLTVTSDRGDVYKNQVLWK